MRNARLLPTRTQFTRIPRNRFITLKNKYFSPARCSHGGEQHHCSRHQQRQRSRHQHHQRSRRLHGETSKAKNLASYLQTQELIRRYELSNQLQVQTASRA
jgi:hypothetical protein